MFEPPGDDRGQVPGRRDMTAAWIVCALIAGLALGFFSEVDGGQHPHAALAAPPAKPPSHAWDSGADFPMRRKASNMPGPSDAPATLAAHPQNKRG